VLPPWEGSGSGVVMFRGDVALDLGRRLPLFERKWAPILTCAPVGMLSLMNMSGAT
jgi:hypothetical protein